MSLGTPPLTEKEYWRDYDIIRNDVNAAMVSCYTHRRINDVFAADRAIADRVNRSAEFWRVTSFSLHTTLFIVLARIFDHDDDVHSVHHVLNATIAHPEFFNKQALRARKLSTLIGQPTPFWLDEYVQQAWEPSTRDLRALKKALAPHKTKFDSIYRPIRHQIAHIIYKDQQTIADLYSKTLKTDIDEILCFLHSLIQAIWELAFNATPPETDCDKHGYARRVDEIGKDTEQLLRSLA